MSGAPNFSSNWPARRSTMACRSASVVSVTIASVDQPRLSMPKKPERSATRCFWPSVSGSWFQNTNAPETAHSPGSAARSKTSVSDGSSLMVRGNLNMSASSEFRTARLRIIPSRLGERIHKTGPLGRSAAGWRGDQEVAAEVDPSALAGLSAGKPCQIIPRARLKPALVPQVEGGHEMAGEAADDRVGVDHLKTFAQQGNAGGGLHLLDMGHIRGAQHEAEHQPCRNLVLGAIRRPAEPRAAKQAAVEQNRIRPVETHFPLGRAMGGNRVCRRIHPGEKRPARR